ncbi:hypothetical protein KAR91_77535 [Candidatus Pacearchaeota archaeon]|nr:hypothetical protein [Candidatus Pacearchaeota archaeon]
MADFTKSQGQVLDWTVLDGFTSDIPFVETSMQTKSDEIAHLLNIVVAHNDIIDTATSHVIIKVLVRAGADDEAWRTIVELQSGGGQAVTESLNANSGASEANPERIEVASTADWDDADCGKTLFLLDAGTLADSCLVEIKGWADNDYYICAWDLERDYDNADSLFDGVSQHTILIPASAQYYNVMLWDTHGTGTYAVRVDYTEVDAIA